MMKFTALALLLAADAAQVMKRSLRRVARNPCPDELANRFPCSSQALAVEF